MPTFDITSQLHKDFFATFPHLKAEAAQAVFWSPVQSLRIDGREAADTSSPTHTGMFLTAGRQIVLYCGSTSTSRNWTRRSSATISIRETRTSLSNAG
jgi:hypothetical protein